jgi:hypothetical protein
MSEYISEYLRTNLPKDQPRIVTLVHPVESINIPVFTMEKYVENANKHILQIGQQLRKVTSIFKIESSGHKKLWLTGNPDLKACANMLESEHKFYKTNTHINHDIIYYTKTFEEYDALLDKNIVFIDLFDSAANNTVLECIARNTPIILNRTPGVVEYLGDRYPLYFNTLDEVSALMTIENITAGHEYLKKMDKSRFTLDYFVRSFANAVCI